MITFTTILASSLFLVIPDDPGPGILSTFQKKISFSPLYPSLLKGELQPQKYNSPMTIHFSATRVILSLIFRNVTTPLPNGRGFLGQVPGSVAPEPKYFWRH